MKKSLSYALIGVLNTLCHASVFMLLVYIGHFAQALANFVAFLVAVTLSYVLNSHFTFKTPKKIKKYLLFTTIMGLISISVGWLGDKYQLYPVATFVIFSALSFILGFLLSKYWIFKDE